MNSTFEDLLKALGETVSLQMQEANDRAEAAETRMAQVVNGLNALVGEVSTGTTSPMGSAPIKAKLYRASLGPRHNDTQGMPDSAFLDALSGEWIGAGKLHKLLISRGFEIAEGTVYNRMRKLCAENPDVVETTTKPERWRLKSSDMNIAGKSAREAKAAKRAKRQPAVRVSRGTLNEMVATNENEALPLSPANDMPPAAITNVRERVASQLPPQQMFEPSLHRGDCFEAMKSMAHGSVDLILTDPPFGTTGLEIDPQIDVAALWAEYRRIIKPTGTIVMFGSQPFTSRIVCEARDLFKHDLVWIKNRPTGSLQVRNRPLKQHEDILVFTAGTTIQASRSTRRYNYQALGQTSAGMRRVSMASQSTHLHDVKHNPGREYEGTTNNPRTTLYCPKETGGQHPFQKPLDLLEYLIRTYSHEGDLVLDTFMGSGSTCVAAMRSGRRSIGIEMTNEYHRVAEKRVAAAKMEMGGASKLEVLQLPSRSNGMSSEIEKTGVVAMDTSVSCGISQIASAPRVPFIKTDRAALYQGDCLEVMKTMRSGSVDLVVTSPPYNLSLSKRRGMKKSAKSSNWHNAKLADGYGSYDDALPHDEYIAWMREVLRESWRLLSNDGAIFMNHKPRIQKGTLWTPHVLNPDLPLRQIAIWDRGSGHNFNETFFTPTHEWVMIFAKPGFRLKKGEGKSPKDVWKIPFARKNDHPAPFPVELPLTAIQHTHAKIVLDPFMGSGTTGVAAMRCGRKFIGIELHEKYAADAGARIEAEARNFSVLDSGKAAA